MKRYTLPIALLVLVVFINQPVTGQTREQKKIDSLSKIALSNVKDTNKVMALYHLAIIYRRNDPQKALHYVQEALQLAQELKWKKGEAECLKNQGNTYHLLSDYPKERGCFELSLKIFEDLHDTLGIGKCLNNIGITYYYLSDFPKALEYYNKSLKIMEAFGNKQGIANSLNNIGGVYNTMADYSKALEYYERTLKIKKELGDKTGIAICLSNIGNRYKNLHDYPKALSSYEESLKISQEKADKTGIASALESMGDIQYLMADYTKALKYCGKSLEISKSIGALDIQRDALKTLSGTYEKLGQLKKSLEYYQQFIKIRDSIVNENKVKEITQTTLKIQFARNHTADSLAYEQEKLRTELSYMESLEKKKKQRNLLIISFITILVISVALVGRLRYTRKSQARLQKEKDRSENLLLNILPAEIAQELKEKGAAEARDFEEVSVLFADIQDFTGTIENMTARELVEEINTCFGAFDNICSSCRVEKIKTIGDSYMSAGGIPIPYPGSVKNTVMAAIRMQEFMIRRKHEREALRLPAFEMRLGIHTGPIVAGIVGVKKFHYDIWGNTVNIASRMESSGVVGRVNISHSTYERIKDDPDLIFECRGDIETKNMGRLVMYFADRKSSPTPGPTQ
jgi:adenylate cyclase